MKKQWFETWFDSRYYHLLYHNRDLHEASHFLTNLLEYLQPDLNDSFLDLACGKGRHSIYLNSLGYQVDGIDYSRNNIKKAKTKENPRLKFYQHDMRKAFPSSNYTYIINLFTSFGYFNNDHEHQICLEHAYAALIENGIFVIDFLNKEQVLKTLIPHEVIKRDGIEFHINKKMEEGYIKKSIAFLADGDEYSFTESVRCFSLAELEGMLKTVKFNIKARFGNYNLDSFNSNSERLIILAQK